MGDHQIIIDYYLNELKILTHFFESNLAFYQYIRTGGQHLDDQYFLPGVFNVHLDPDESIVDFEPAFNTSHGNKLARLQANEMILTYLDKAMRALHSREETSLEDLMKDELVVWTQTDTALIEMVYGWKETGAINHGKLSVERTVRYLEKVFHIKLGNVYDTWNYICQRANKTIYTDEVKKALLEKIERKLR